MTKATVTNIKIVSEKKYDCDGSYFEEVKYGTVECQNCHSKKTKKVGHIGNGDSDNCPNCNTEFFYQIK